MIFTWKTFKIDLQAFLDFLQSSIPNSDGIYATEDYFEIKSLTEFTVEESQAITDYYDSLQPTQG